MFLRDGCILMQAGTLDKIAEGFGAGEHWWAILGICIVGLGFFVAIIVARFILPARRIRARRKNVFLRFCTANRLTPTERFAVEEAAEFCHHPNESILFVRPSLLEHWWTEDDERMKFSDEAYEILKIKLYGTPINTIEDVQDQLDLEVRSEPLPKSPTGTASTNRENRSE